MYKTLVHLCFCIRYQSGFSVQRRCDVPLLTMGLIFGSIMGMVLMEDLDQKLFFWITLAFVCISGFATAVLQGGVFGLASLLPQAYTQAIMSGQGLAGIAVAAASLISTAVVSGDSSKCDAPYSSVKGSALGYFGFSALVLFFCIIGFYVLCSLEFFQYYASSVLGPPNGRMLTSTRADDLEDNSAQFLLDAEELLSDVKEEEINVVTVERLKVVFGSVKTLALSVFSIFLVTLLVFPSTTVQIQSLTRSKNPIYNELWIPLSFLNFNLFDFLGRVFSGMKPYPFNPEHIWIPTLLRVAFPIMFLFCYTGDEGVVPNVFNNDIWPVFIMALFALSNGYLSSCMMMLGPKAVDISQAEIAGTIMLVFLTFGLLGGSLVSFLLLPLTKGHW